MKLLVISAIVSAAVANPQSGYTPPTGLYDNAPAPIFHNAPASTHHNIPAPTYHDVPANIHHKVPARTYPPAPAPIYHPGHNSAHNPTHKPAQAPTYKPAQAPTYKPAHTPTYTPPHTPTYTPAHTPTYTPPHTPTYTPAHTPSYSTQQRCGKGEVRKGDGSCARPIVTRNLYLYNGPTHKHTYTPPTHYPQPKVHYNFVFVRTADGGQGPRPIVAPVPEQKTLVYVLSKRPEDQEREVIEVPANPSKPEVFFVKYSDGENAKLPGGIDLQTALSQSAHQGQVIHGAGGGYGASGGSINLRGNGYSAGVHANDHLGYSDDVHGDEHGHGVQYNGDEHGHGVHYSGDH